MLTLQRTYVRKGELKTVIQEYNAAAVLAWYSFFKGSFNLVQSVEISILISACGTVWVLGEESCIRDWLATQKTAN